jgi:hypothetical protein
LNAVGWRARVPLFAAALWWGSLTAVGFISVPLLFSHLPVATAGQMAGRLFAGQAWTSIGCGVLLLMGARGVDEPARMDWAGGAVGFVLAGLILALLGEYAVAPRILAHQDLAFWHAAGTLFYGAQWLCALAVLWKLSGPTSSATSAASSPS